MKITQVERQKKNTKRFNIYLDGKFALGADEDAVVDHRLILGKELSEEDLERILFATEVGKLMERMYGLFSVRMRSEKEVRDYLKQLSFKRKLKDLEELSEVVIEALIERLKQKDLLNDERFASEWIHARRVSKQKGINAIKAELYQKGIDREIIESKFDSRHQDEDGEEWNEDNEETLAMRALEKKIKNPALLEDRKEKQRILGFLMRKGFSYDVARSVIEKILKKE
jgi:regulatory protein